jgi:GT2 family glycosyltransferase
MVVVVIPAFVRTARDAAWLSRCVSAVAAERAVDRIVVVDDASPLAVAGLPEGVEVLRLPENGGPARARNAGTDRALALGARIVLFTDHDCVVEAGWAEAMVAFLDGGEFAAAGGVTRALGETLLDRYHDFAGSLNGRWVLPAREELLYAPTCNFGVRAEALAGVRFDERFPGAAGEDVDFCVRVRRSGRIGLNPAALVRHDFGYGSTLGGLARFRGTFRKYAAADPLLERLHPELDAVRTEACAARDLGAKRPPLDPAAYRRGSMRRTQPRRLVPAIFVLKQVAKHAYERERRAARRRQPPSPLGGR